MAHTFEHALQFGAHAFLADFARQRIPHLQQALFHHAKAALGRP